MEKNFDEYATHYRDIHTKNICKISGVDSDYFSEYKILEVNKMIKGKVLDLGCGDGNSATYMYKRCPDIEYFGIDVSSQSIEVAKKRGIFGARFALYDGSNIPFPEKYFDTIFIACVLHHVDLDDRFNLLNECYRVLKPGGKIIVFEHNPNNILTQKTVKDCPFDEGVTLVKPRIMKKYFEAIGYKNIVLNYTIFMPRKKFFLKFLWMEKYLKKCPIGGQYYIVGGK